jgi:hypothetical protein
LLPLAGVVVLFAMPERLLSRRLFGMTSMPCTVATVQGCGAAAPATSPRLPPSVL